MCCLKCLQPLYESEELAPRLELFTNRFKVLFHWQRTIYSFLNLPRDFYSIACVLTIIIICLRDFSELLEGAKKRMLLHVSLCFPSQVNHGILSDFLSAICMP